MDDHPRRPQEEPVTRPEGKEPPPETTRNPAPDVVHEPEPDAENLVPAKDEPGTL